MNRSRRHFVCTSMGGAAAVAGLLTPSVYAATTSSLGNSDLHIISDGHLSLPMTMVFPDKTDKDAFLASNSLDVSHFEPACNLTLWKNGEHLVLFDVGAGHNFMPTAGKVMEDLDKLGIRPEDITDIVFTHAHPDHLWGLIDDFDELVFTNARYHMNATEWSYWWDDNTVNTVPETMQAMAVGAKNRMQYIKDQVNLFHYGDELLPNIEAVDSHGHTPGHTSFALHQGSHSIMVLGDVLTHTVLSFQKPDWAWGTDQDPQAAIATRLSLLDRLAQDKMRIVGYHFPHPGLGAVEKRDSRFHYVDV